MVQVGGRLQNKVLNGFHHFDGDGLKSAMPPMEPTSRMACMNSFASASGQDGWFFIPGFDGLGA